MTKTPVTAATITDAEILSLLAEGWVPLATVALAPSAPATSASCMTNARRATARKVLADVLNHRAWHARNSGLKLMSCDCMGSK